MRKVWLSVLILFIPGISLLAQLQPRDYVVADAKYVFSSDSTAFVIEFTVTNQGGDALVATDVNIVGADNRILNPEEERTLQPLKAGDSVRLQFPFTTTDFPPGSTQVFEIQVGIDLYELAGTEIAKNNIASVSVPIPTGISRPPENTNSSTGETAPAATPAVSVPALEFKEGKLFVNGVLFLGREGDTIFFLGSRQSPEKVLIAAIIVVGIVLLLWLLTVVLRLLLRRRPKFGIWQPAYATMPTMDPGSVAGRRQAWQSHAQNGTILAAPTEGNLHPVKLLLSQDGTFMKNWRITGMRLSQYDSYGRVARSETIAPKWMLNRLNNILKRNATLDNDGLSRRARPIARALVNQFRRVVRKRSTHLPIALDIRFEGKQGEVRIAFELYQCQKFAWHRLDRWEPIMAIIGSRLPENYTYTIHGQSGGETIREFFNRLPEDVEWLLCETVRSRGVPPQEVPPPQTFDVPDTLSGMQPVISNTQMPMGR